MTRALRFVAIAIAIAGAIDPAIAVSGASRARVAIVALQPASPVADGVRDRLVRDLSSSYEVVPDVTSDAAAAVVIGERYPEASLPESLQVATVTTTPPATSGARIVRIDAPRDVPGATMIRLDVELDGSGASGSTTEVTATIAGLEVGRASHRWTAGEQRWRASIDAVPVGNPPYAVQIRSFDGLSTATRGVEGRLKADTTETADASTPVVFGFSRTVADVLVDARRAPLRVEFYDPRPSWATTFLRRALEADARFQVSTLGFTSRGVSVQSGGGVPLGDPRLDTFDVVIVGGLERLSAADGRALDRYMRERGGAVALVPDQRIDAGAARDLLFAPDPRERLLEQPAKLVVTPPAAPLQASELLVLSALPPGSDVVARIPGADLAPVIASAPRGDGRLLFSGAMDAWRFRAADHGAFDRFWQSTIAGLALAVAPPIAVDLDPPLLRPGERGDVTVRLRSRDVTAVSASLDGDQPIRLQPDPEAGVYRGRFVARAAPGRSTVEASAAAARPLSASRTLLVQRDVRRVRQSAAPALAMLASSHRGIDVSPDRVPELERFLRGAIATPRVPLVRHPMRSAWWIVPFALCLSAEWWIRRRRGLR